MASLDGLESVGDWKAFCVLGARAFGALPEWPHGSRQASNRNFHTNDLYGYSPQRTKLTHQGKRNPETETTIPHHQQFSQQRTTPKPACTNTLSLLTTGAGTGRGPAAPLRATPYPYCGGQANLGPPARLGCFHQPHLHVRDFASHRPYRMYPMCFTNKVPIVFQKTHSLREFIQGLRCR